jgi:hypothetical protein
VNYIENIYRFARLAGGKMPQREFPPIIAGTENTQKGAQGTMAQSRTDQADVLFEVDCAGISVAKSIYIVGNQKVLGNWTPNSIAMFNDGTHGDKVANDDAWSLEVQLPIGTEVEYKYTNSGAEGSWSPSEEFPGSNRKVLVKNPIVGKMIVRDRFGVK